MTLIDHLRKSTALMRLARADGRMALMGVRGVWLGCGVVLILLWGTFAWIMLREARQVEHQQEVQTRLEARGFAQYVGLNVLLVDRLLVNVRDSYRASGALPSQASLAARMGPYAPLLLQVSAADATGKLVASTLASFSKASIADRSHFLAFAADPTDRLYFSQPVVGRVSGKLSLQLVRPLLSSAGEFRGVIVASIDPVVLRRYFDMLDMSGEQRMVTIVGREDGLVRIRYSDNSISSGESILSSPIWKSLAGSTSGAQKAMSVLDGLERLIAFHQIGDYPLAVTVSTPTQSTWDLVKGSLRLALFMALAFSLVLIMLSHARALLEVEQQENIKRLRASRNQELEANQMKSNFLASVSHDLRTPLNSILGFSELIRDDPGGAGTSRFAQLIHNNGTHLHALVNTLLDLAKIEAGRMDVDRQEVDVRELLTAVTDTHRVSADKKGLGLSLTLPAAGRIIVNSDRTKLVQVLNNILHNAIKFTRKGQIAVHGAALGEGFRIRVTDSGPGISDLTRVFDRFNTVASEAQQHNGSGLGLALSKNLMELLGGSISIRSEAGAGTQVDIFLPKVTLIES